GSLRRDYRRDAAVEQVDQQFDDLDTNARVAARERMSAQEHGSTRRVKRQRFADAARVAAHEIALERHRIFGWNGDVFQAPEAGGHAVDALAGRDRLFDQIARRFDPWTALWIEDHLRSVAGN